jgi:phospholipid/cholesterol/gamma-HCH transport system substrate-binding protein
VSTPRQFRWTVVYLIGFTALSVLVTAVVITTLLDVHPGASTAYRAEFSDASGLQAGDTVRIAGVEVGAVNGVQLVGDRPVVSFTVDNSQHLSTSTHAEIHYENLLGQRFLALVDPPGSARPLPAGALIPMSHTKPALDLTSVFNGFQPLFAALTPNQVNQLTASIIGVFQGQSGTIDTLTAQTAALTSNLAQRQLVIDEVLGNLSALLTTVGAHDRQLGELIDQFSNLVNGLAAQRSDIASTIDGVGVLTTELANTLSQSQPALNQSINGLASFATSLAADQQNLNALIQGFPDLLNAVNKAISSGSYLSVYICNLTVIPEGQLNVSLVPGVPAPQPGDPITIPGGPVGDQSQHTANCR